MRLIEITALFPSPEHAQLAIQRLSGSVEQGRIRVSAERVVHVAVTTTAAEPISGALKESGALAVTQQDPPLSPGWMSHQSGRVTGTGVEPGAGDAEAGSG